MSRYHGFFRPEGGRIALLFFLSQLCLLAIGAVAFPGQVLADEVEVLIPRSGTTVIARFPEIHLVVRQSRTGPECRVKMEKVVALAKPIVVMADEKQNYLHFRLPLVPGFNRFEIIPGNQVIEINYQPIKGALNKSAFTKDVQLFHNNSKLPASCEGCHDFQEIKTIDPVGLLKEQTSCTTCHKNFIEKNKFKHSTTVNHQCLVCHQQAGKPFSIAIPLGKIDDTCYACHTGKKNIRSLKYRHGPMMAGCTLCHSPHGEQYRYQLWAEGSLELCVTCHSNKQDLLKRKAQEFSVHWVIRGAGCTLCHDPHATNELFMLRKPINELCLGCHLERIDLAKGHPVARHPVTGFPERRRPGRQLTCVSCHDPHGSAYQYMLVETRVGGLICRGCHKR